MDQIDRPSHYCEGRLIEPIEVIEDWGLGFHLGSAIKYISRAGRKPYGISQYEDDQLHSEIQDLLKAIWFIRRRIKRLHVMIQDFVEFDKQEEQKCSEK